MNFTPIEQRRKRKKGETKQKQNNRNSNSRLKMLKPSDHRGGLKAVKTISCSWENAQAMGGAPIQPGCGGEEAKEQIAKS